MTREKAIEKLKGFDLIGSNEDIEFQEALDMATKALEQEPILEKDGTLVVTTDNYAKVSRVLVQHGTNGTLFYQDQDQEPKTGRWIKSSIPNEEYVCSECGGGCWYYDYQASVAKSRYCPNCGAKMER